MGARATFDLQRRIKFLANLPLLLEACEPGSALDPRYRATPAALHHLPKAHSGGTAKLPQRIPRGKRASTAQLDAFLVEYKRVRQWKLRRQRW